MSALLDSLCGSARLAEIAANERAMLIQTHDTPSLSVVEEWRYEELAMEGSDE